MVSGASCAVWYWRHGAVYYELCANEDEAVRWAFGLQESESGAVGGVQFDDGRYIDRKDWTALEAYENEVYEAERERWRNAPPAAPPPRREVAAPWDPSRKVSVLADAPSWLGASLSRDKT